MKVVPRCRGVTSCNRCVRSEQGVLCGLGTACNMCVDEGPLPKECLLGQAVVGLLGVDVERDGHGSDLGS